MAEDLKIIDTIDPTKIQVNLNLEQLNKDTDGLIIKELKKAQSGVPTHLPNTFKEQFYFQDDGTLWVYINNVWAKYIKNGALTNLRAYKSETQTIGSTLTKVTFDAKTFDLDNSWSTAHSRFYAPSDGYYRFSVQWLVSNAASGTEYVIRCYLNETSIAAQSLKRVSYNDQLFVDLHDVIYLTKDQYLTFHSLGNTSYNVEGGSSTTFLSISKI